MSHVYFKLSEASSASLALEHSTLSLFCQLVWSLVCLTEDLPPKQLLVDREWSHVFVDLALVSFECLNVLSPTLGLLSLFLFPEQEHKVS